VSTLREHRIRALAYRIHEASGRDDAEANWHQAATLIDTYPSHDFEVRQEGKKSAIYLADRDNRHTRFPI
jgi:hypothetical protein